MSAEATIKSQARQILKKNYVPAIAAILIVLIPFYIIDGTTTALSYFLQTYIPDKDLAITLIYSIGYPVEVFAYFFFSPLINGYISAYYHASCSGTMKLQDVFSFFQRGRYGSALGLNMHFVLRMFFPTLLIFAPYIAFQLIVTFFYPDFESTLLYFQINFILTVLSVGMTFLYSLRYFTVFTIGADNPQFTPKQIFSYNRYIMKKKSGSAAKLAVSFIPWLLLCLLVLPMLYVIPYLTESMCVSAKWMTKAALEEE